MSVSIEDLKTRIGSEIGVPGWLLIDQEMIDSFAKLTGDNQFHHVDLERAKASPFGGTIAHGMLTLSLLRSMYESSNAPRVEGMKMVVSYGANRLRITSPVRSGKRVRGRFKLLDVMEKVPSAIIETLEFKVDMEGEEKPALIAEWLIQIIL
jgi:acyl dehydratase